MKNFNDILKEENNRPDEMLTETAMVSSAAAIRAMKRVADQYKISPDLKETLIKAKDFLHYIGKGHLVRKQQAEELSQEIIMHLTKDETSEKKLLEIKVKEVHRYRDGGTIKFQDEFGQDYYQWWGNKRIFNVYPTDEAKALKEFEELPDSTLIFERKVKLIILGDEA